MTEDDITPIRKQYLEIKRQYPDAILFFRLGDFYETFDQDAETGCARAGYRPDLAHVAKGARVPMAGIPHHAAENYLARLIERGFHVAICEQVGDQPVERPVPAQGDTCGDPGTVIEPGCCRRCQQLPGLCRVRNSGDAKGWERAGVAMWISHR